MLRQDPAEGQGRRLGLRGQFPGETLGCLPWQVLQAGFPIALEEAQAPPMMTTKNTMPPKMAPMT